MKSNKRLYYFTSSFPYGLGETWKSNELKYLSNQFADIVVVPHSYSNNFNNPKELPPGIVSEKPLFHDEHISYSRYSFWKLLDTHLFYYLEEFFDKKVFLDKRIFISWLNASLRIKRLISHPFVNKIINNPDKNAILYFFWGKDSCDFIPFLKKKSYAKIMVRFHRHDLFEDQNNGYIPYRKKLLSSVDIAAPSSFKGLNHLQSLYDSEKAVMQVVPLGVVDNGVVEMSEDDVLRILSCSLVVPVKRVHLIAEAVKYLDFPVEWTHVGEGPLMKSVKEAAQHLPDNVSVHFPGMIDTSEMISFYKKKRFDLFVNVSSSEGVPLSIMESLSLGIPVFATDVGGTSDIVDDGVGKLLSSDVKPPELASAFANYYKLPVDQKLNLRKSAKNRFFERCNAEFLTEQLAKMLLS